MGIEQEAHTSEAHHAAEAGTWRHRGCRGQWEAGGVPYPGRRVCHRCGAAVCIGSLTYLHPSPEQSGARLLTGQLQGHECVFDIVRFVNRQP